jgi:putative tryptophan/tyrosine transport system substrate-binding protein
MSYGADLREPNRMAGNHVDRLLKGEKPADLPVQQAAEVGLVGNLKTDKSLGLTIPQTLLATADEVVQNGGSSSRGLGARLRSRLRC